MTDVKVHPWNTSFQWKTHSGPFRYLTEEQVKQFDEDGFVLLKSVLDPETVARTVDEIDAWEAKADRQYPIIVGGNQVNPPPMPPRH